MIFNFFQAQIILGLKITEFLKLKPFRLFFRKQSFRPDKEY